MMHSQTNTPNPSQPKRTRHLELLQRRHSCVIDAHTTSPTAPVSAKGVVAPMHASTMFFGRKPKTPQNSPVLVVDALGFANRIEAADATELAELAEELDSQYHRFRAKIPFAAVIVTSRRVLGTREFSTFRLNDMFVLFSEKLRSHFALRYLVTSSLLYQQLLLESFVPRGGLGFGLVLQRNGSVLGQGFIDAYRMAEKRHPSVRHICAIEVSPQFLLTVPNTEQAYRLLCFYKDRFFVNPRLLVDPDMGEFDDLRILELLRSAGANREKLTATEAFLRDLEDYDAALQPGSESRKCFGWRPFPNPK